MSSKRLGKIFSTSKISQWFKTAHLVPLTDADCYWEIYGDLIQYVNHYMIPKLNISPGSLNYFTKYQLMFYCIIEPPIY